MTERQEPEARPVEAVPAPAGQPSDGRQAGQPQAGPSPSGRTPTGQTPTGQTPTGQPPARRSADPEVAAARRRARESLDAVRGTLDGLPTAAKWSAATLGAAAVVTAAGVAVARARRRRAARAAIFHVRPEGERWGIVIGDRSSPDGVFDTKAQAVAAARRAAHDHTPSELVVHRSDGTPQAHHRYGDGESD